MRDAGLPLEENKNEQVSDSLEQLFQRGFIFVVCFWGG